MSPEFHLLLLSIRLTDREHINGEAIRIINDYKIDWDFLYRLAADHSVRPQLAKLMNSLPSGLLPEELMQRLENEYQTNLYDQLSNASEFIKVYNILKNSGIRIVPFKGFWLGYEMYENIADREASDVDVFVDFNDILRLREIMLKNGYVIEEQMKHYSVDDLIRKSGEYNFDKIQSGRSVFHIEFHWRISSPVYGLNINIKDLENNISTGKLDANEINVFDKTANLLLAILHHAGKDPLDSLKNELDIALIIKKDPNIDWDWLLSKAKKLKSENLVYISVKIASELTGIDIPGRINTRCNLSRISRLASNRIRFMEKSLTYWHPWIFINDWLFRIRSRSGFRTKLRLTVYISRVLIKRFFRISA